MKTINTLVSATLTALALSAPYAIADDAHHPDQPKTQSATTAAPVAPASVDKSVQTMKENTKKMQTQLDKIGRTKNPQERQKLLHEHMQTMKENMMMGKGMMGDMMGCPMMKEGMMGEGMMGGGMMGGGMGMRGGATAPDAMMNRMNMMEKRMDMMQMMMEQMTKSQAQPKQEK